MKLRFQNLQTIRPSNLGVLSKVHLEQLRLSGTAYGHDSKTPAETLAQTFSAEEDGLGFTEFWQVADDQSNEILYDVWVFDVDTAMVYFADTTEDVGVSMMQFSFDIVEVNDTLDQEELCADLQEAYENKPDEAETDSSSPLGAYKEALKNVSR